MGIIAGQNNLSGTFGAADHIRRAMGPTHAIMEAQKKIWPGMGKTVKDELVTPNWANSLQNTKERLLRSKSMDLSKTLSETNDRISRNTAPSQGILEAQKKVSQLHGPTQNALKMKELLSQAAKGVPDIPKTTRLLSAHKGTFTSSVGNQKGNEEEVSRVVPRNKPIRPYTASPSPKARFSFPSSERDEEVTNAELKELIRFIGMGQQITYDDLYEWHEHFDEKWDVFEYRRRGEAFQKKVWEFARMTGFDYQKAKEIIEKIFGGGPFS